MTKIRELRISRKISQKEFAKAIGVPANTLCQWETGKRAPDYEMLKKIAAYFGVSADYLLDIQEEKLGDEVKSLIPLFNESDSQDREFWEMYSKLTPEERRFLAVVVKEMLSKK